MATVIQSDPVLTDPILKRQRVAKMLPLVKI